VRKSDRANIVISFFLCVILALLEEGGENRGRREGNGCSCAGRLAAIYRLILGLTPVYLLAMVAPVHQSTEFLDSVRDIWVPTTITHARDRRIVIRKPTFAPGPQEISRVSAERLAIRDSICPRTLYTHEQKNITRCIRCSTTLHRADIHRYRHYRG
jgi:hypothetical protein